MEKIKNLINKIKDFVKANRKLSIIVGGVVLLLVIGLIIFSFLNNDKDLEAIILDKALNEKNPILVKENDLYGYVTYDGQAMIKPKYDYASNFIGEYAVVKKDDKYSVINRDKKVIVSTDSNYGINYYEEFDIWEVDNKLYDEKFKQITGDNLKVDYKASGFLTFRNLEDNSSGILNYQGKKIYTWESGYIYLDISSHDKDNLNEFYGYITDNNKKAIIDLQTGKIIYNIENPEEMYVDVKSDNVFVIKNNTDYKVETIIALSNGKIAYKTNDDVEISYYTDNILKIYDRNKDYNERTKYYNIKTNKFIDEAPDKNNDSQDTFTTITGYKLYSCNNGKGVMNKDDIIISCKYDDITNLPATVYKYLKNRNDVELIYVENDKKTMLYDLKSKEAVTTFDATYIYDASDSTFIKYNKTKKTIVYNLLSRSTKTFDKDSTITLESNYVTVKKNNKTSYYNYEFKKVFESEG